MTSPTYRFEHNRTKLFVREGKIDLLNEVFQLLKDSGFQIQTDKEIEERYPSLSKSRWEGIKGKLLFKSKIYPAGFEIEFYQEENTKNRNGGYYDFDKYQNMPYLIRCQFILIRNKIKNLLDSKEVKNESKPVHSDSLSEVLYRIKDCWHYKEGKELPEHEEPLYNSEDKYGKRIYNGQIKYFRDSKGRLMRGTVYHNINNMWWTILNKKEFTNVAAFNFFDLEDEEDYSPKVYSREMPQRIRTEKLRVRFNEKYDYSMLFDIHISHLRLLVSHELLGHDKEMNMSVKAPLKKDTVVRKTLGLKSANIKVNGSYFTGREGITFNEGGFIGFAGWASGYNIKPFANAFEKWLDWLDINIVKE